MNTITHIRSREIIDSRGTPTLEADVVLASGITACASVPSGSDSGAQGVRELRDHDMARYQGRGVLNAVVGINTEIQEALVGLSIFDQQRIDDTLAEIDGTDDKSNLGANATLAVSIAAARAAAKARKVPLYSYVGELAGNSRSIQIPVPLVSLISAGGPSNNRVDFKDFMIQPLFTDSLSEALRCCTEVYQCLRKLLTSLGLGTAVSDSGGFCSQLSSNEEAIRRIEQAVHRAGYSLGKDVSIALDCAASRFYQNGCYLLSGVDQPYDSRDFSNYLSKLASDYPIIAIEDGMDESDWEGWTLLTQQLGDQLTLVGNELFASNPQRIKEGMELNVANAISIKSNGIGTLSETLMLIQKVVNNGYQVVISDCDGDTEDSAIADLAVASQATWIKTGAPCRSERVAKYNRLMWIEEQLSVSKKQLDLSKKQADRYKKQLQQCPIVSNQKVSSQKVSTLQNLSIQTSSRKISSNQASPIQDRSLLPPTPTDLPLTGAAQ